MILFLIFLNSAQRVHSASPSRRKGGPIEGGARRREGVTFGFGL